MAAAIEEAHPAHPEDSWDPGETSTAETPVGMPQRRIVLGQPSHFVRAGIVGLPNAGKTSLFNALTQRQHPTEPFPFSTVRASTARTMVPDARLDWLEHFFRPHSTRPSVFTVSDTPGVTHDTSGAGLNGVVTDALAPCDVLYMVLRAFEYDAVTHVLSSVDPARDIDVVTRELVKKDTVTVRIAAEGLRRNVETKSSGSEKKLEFDCLVDVLNFLTKEKLPVRLGGWSDQQIRVINQHRLLTAKEVVYVLNVSPIEHFRGRYHWLRRVQEKLVTLEDSHVVPVSLWFEDKLNRVTHEHGPEGLEFYLTANPSHEQRREPLLRRAFQALKLVHFYTCGPDEVRVWSVRAGSTALEAAASIHPEFEAGFVTVQVEGFADLHEVQDEEAMLATGKMQTQSKKYIVQDGDICFFQFSLPPPPIPEDLLKPIKKPKAKAKKK